MRISDWSSDVCSSDLLSLQESAIENGEIAVTEYLALGKLARRNGDNHAMVPWRAYPCADGEAAIIGGPIRHWLKAAEMFEQPELLEGPLADMGGRMREREKLEALIPPWLARQPKRELFPRGVRKRPRLKYRSLMRRA